MSGHVLKIVFVVLAIQFGIGNASFAGWIGDMFGSTEKAMGVAPSGYHVEEFENQLTKWARRVREDRIDEIMEQFQSGSDSGCKPVDFRNKMNELLNDADLGFEFESCENAASGAKQCFASIHCRAFGGGFTKIRRGDDLKPVQFMLKCTDNAVLLMYFDAEEA
eukprot:51142_1